MKRPYGAHVPPPDSENFWPFTSGQVRTIGTGLSFQVDEIHQNWVEGTQVLDGQTIHGKLELDQPVVICKSAVLGVPIVTLTLRKIENGVAFLQVTANQFLTKIGERKLC